MLSGYYNVCALRRDDMINFCVLICTLAALSTTTEAGPLTENRRHESFSSSFSLSSSSSSSSFEMSSVTCFNGGTPYLSMITGENLFCLCADGFEGEQCENRVYLENEDTEQCYEGIGLFYRGTVSRSESGRRCVKWDLETRKHHLSTDVKSGRHNYCRNVHYKRRPWCHVRIDHELVEEYCDIPRCGSELFPALPSPEPIEPEPAAESTCGQPIRRQQMKIVGGKVATVESHPWVAAIFWKSRSKKTFRCGGSLISACWVLTAAHCFPDGSHNKKHRFSVTLGKNALNETDHMEQTFEVEEIIVHERFDNSEGNFNNDIALMKLTSEHGRCAEETKHVKTVCLPPPKQSLRPGVTCEIAGYGKEKFGLWYKSQYLREARVNALANDVCRQEKYYANMITDNMFCAGRPDWSQDACEGDSGGPLVCEVDSRFFLFGVISWGDGCAKEFRPGVYTKVTNYNDWIEEKTGLSSITAGKMFPQK